MKLNIVPLNFQAFKKYGSFEKMYDLNSIKFGDPPIEFYRDLIQLTLSHENDLSFSICHVKKHDGIIQSMENHSFTGEGAMPLDGDILLPLSPASPLNVFDDNAIEVFIIPKFTFVSIRPGVWHDAPLPYKCEDVNVLIALPERTYANDCHEVKLTKVISIDMD